MGGKSLASTIVGFWHSRGLQSQPAEGLLTEEVLKYARIVQASSPTALASGSVCTALPNGASGRLAARRWQDGSIGEVWNGPRDRLRNQPISVFFP